ncbi:MAG: YiiX/YebB-like N1pC/P60 family cysteine hydrolase [Ignavibacteriaceae bacterium]|nr:YiiX/YebB-like N1pC/P60 family cysteine hydrolase [Ignavibacteriaceae bacterium]
MSIKHIVKKHPKIFITISSIVSLYLILLIPFDHNPLTSVGNKAPFSWNRDSLWKSLELKFISSNSEGCDKIKFTVDSLFKNSEMLLNEISSEALDPSNGKFIELENNIFNLAPFIPVCTQYFADYINFYSNLRRIVKEESRHWDMNSTIAKNTLYRLLYGNRIAIEEIMLQLPENKVDPLIKGIDEFSLTPSAEILGVVVHSGDILISRGGAPTSALIARGNDYPGNFSHVALIYITEKTKNVSVIESHIERGVAISSLDEYLNDKKLRIMVLRLRTDLISDNPMLPQEAAKFSLNEAMLKHIPYDFEMNISESEKQFCSEVASSAYKEYGITLWTGLSTISSKGTRSWLAAFGVKNFETQEPSDLEYDPQLSVVAEWRDPTTLYKDHLDNAVTDVMLEEADSGKVLSYDWYALPIGRVMKLYSMILNLFGSEGPVPEGMSAEAALKNVTYSETHDQIKVKLIVLANQFKNERGYTPPYWELVNLARQARDEIED